VNAAVVTLHGVQRPPPTSGKRPVGLPHLYLSESVFSYLCLHNGVSTLSLSFAHHLWSFGCDLRYLSSLLEYVDIQLADNCGLGKFHSFKVPDR